MNKVLFWNCTVVSMAKPLPGGDNTRARPLPEGDNTTTRPLPSRDNTIARPLPRKDNTTTRPLPGENNTMAFGLIDTQGSLVLNRYGPLSLEYYYFMDVPHKFTLNDIDDEVNGLLRTEMKFSLAMLSNFIHITSLFCYYILGPSSLFTYICT